MSLATLRDGGLYNKLVLFVSNHVTFYRCCTLISPWWPLTYKLIAAHGIEFHLPLSLRFTALRLHGAEVSWETDNGHSHKPIIVLFDIQVLWVPSWGALMSAQISFTRRQTNSRLDLPHLDKTSISLRCTEHISVTFSFWPYSFDSQHAGSPTSVIFNYCNDVTRWQTQTLFYFFLYKFCTKQGNLKNKNNNKKTKQLFYIMLQNLHSKTKMHNVVLGAPLNNHINKHIA